MKEFRRAVEARDLGGMLACLSPDVEFLSPVSFKPYRGAEQVGWILATVASIFEDFVYVDELAVGAHSMLRFTMRIGEKAGEGVDLIECGPDGKIVKFTVMIRPLSTISALAEIMRARFSQREGTP